MDDASRLSRARAMGFNTDIVVYHGSRADAFDAFSKDRLGSFTGSASAYLGFYFGTSRENSMSYSGGDPDNTKFKELSGYNEIVKAIKSKCAEAGLPTAFSMGLSSGSALPGPNLLNDKNASVDEIKRALLDASNTRYQKSLADAKEYVERYNVGEYKPKRDYASPTFVAKQVKLVTQQREIVKQVVNDWQEPLRMKDWGWLGAFYLRMRNPYTVDQDNMGRARSFAEIVAQAREDGHDGVIILNTFDPKPTDVYVVFEPEQIRSVAATFDPAKANTPQLMA